jgi:hypothetical protein
MMNGVRSFGVLLLAVVISGCSSTTPASEAAGLPTRIPLPSGRIALPDHEPCEYLVAPGSLCVDTGHAIEGTVHQSGACIWLDLGNGQSVRVVWPFGYSAILDPLTVFGNAGVPVISAGQTIKTGGDGPKQGATDSCGRGSFVEINEPIIAVP